MPTIAAANNLSIRVEGSVWSLVNGSGENAVTVLQANANGLLYAANFGATRRLPERKLHSSQVAMVVVGWAAEDSSWHLGLMVTPDLAQTRGGRWCGLTRWPASMGDNAAQAGQFLAHSLGKPFRLVPAPESAAQPLAPEPQQVNTPQSAPIAYTPPATSYPVAPPSLPESQHLDRLEERKFTTGEFAAQTTEQFGSQFGSPATTALPDEAAETEYPAEVEAPRQHTEVPLMPLPITVGEWTLNELDNGLLWKRSSGWRNKTLLNAVFFAVLASLFGALSIGSKLTQFAPVQPEFLPYVGMGLSALLLLLAIAQIWSLSRASIVLIDNHQKLVRVLRGYNDKTGRARQTIVQSPYEGIDYVLASHVNSREDGGRKSKDPYASPLTPAWLEVWLHLYSPRRGFINVCYVNQVEGQIRVDQDFRERQLLYLDEINSPLHHAALYMGQMLDLPVYVETR
jgi:hypothetical protein